MAPVAVFCAANKRQQEGTCRRPAGYGTSHPGIGRCKYHGGSTPTHVASVELSQAKSVAQLFGVPREVHPVDGLMEEYWRTAGLIDVYEAMCMQLLPSDVVWGVQSVEESNTVQPVDSFGSDGGSDSLTPPERKTKSGTAVNIWVKLLNEERDRFARLGTEILKLDLASRQVEYSASQTAALAGVLLSSELGLSEEQRRVAARLLRGMEQRAAIEAT